MRSAVIAIDVNARTARIDFGRGWFKTMTLLVDGTDVKETAPPASGEDLGFFHFDLTQKSGGFSGGSEPHEVFDACVESGANVTSMPQPDVAEAPTVNETPPTDTVEPSTPPTFGQGAAEYYGGKETRTNPALAADATIKVRDYKKAATQSTASGRREGAGSASDLRTRHN